MLHGLASDSRRLRRTVRAASRCTHRNILEVRADTSPEAVQDDAPRPTYVVYMQVSERDSEYAASPSHLALPQLTT